MRRIVGQRPTALVIDDDKAYSHSICDVLEAAGVKMYVASDASDAEELLRFLVPDLLIVDLRMPGMSGPVLTNWLRGKPGWRKVPIIVASALAMRADRDTALASGADAFLPKPFTTKELRATARRFLPTVQTAPLRPAM